MRLAKRFSSRVIIAVACLVAVGGLFAFARSAHAEEPCLRGGDGSCVYVSSGNTASWPPVGGEARFMLGGANSHNVAQLSDGTLLAAVAEFQSDTFFNRVYQIYLWRSIDGGLTWTKPSIQSESNKPIVNEILPDMWDGSTVGTYACKTGDAECLDGDSDYGQGRMGSWHGSGFLGYSMAVSEQSGKTMIYLAYSISCAHGVNGGYENPMNQVRSPFTPCGTALADLLAAGASQQVTAFHDSAIFLKMYEYDGNVITARWDPDFSCGGACVGNDNGLLLTRVPSYKSGSGGYTNSTQLDLITCKSTASGGSAQSGGCQGIGFGANHPSLGVGKYDSATGIEDLFMSFHAYRGDFCATCPYQDGSSISPFSGTQRSSSELWVRKIDVDANTFNLFSDDNMVRRVHAGNKFSTKLFKEPQYDNADPEIGIKPYCWTLSDPNLCEYNPDASVADPGFGNPAVVYDTFDERHAWYSTITFGPTFYEYSSPPDYLISRPVVFGAYSRNDGTGVRREHHKLGCWYSFPTAGQWNNCGPVQDSVNIIWSTPKPNGDFRAAITLEENGSSGVADTATGPVTIVPVISVSSTTTNVVFTGYADRQKVGNLTTAVPFWVTYYGVYNPNRSATGSSIARPADRIINPKANPGDPDDPNLEQYALVNAGGPTIGRNAGNVFVSFPAVAKIIFDTSPANALKYTDIYYSPGSSTYGSVRLTPNNDKAVLTSTGFSHPVLPPTIANNQDTGITTSLTNIFTPPVFFSRVQDVGQKCSGTNACRITYAGNYNTHGVRGWAWASTVGWISLSCKNLDTCYRKNQYVSQEGGDYYGVRVVSNPKLAKKPLVGKAWSERIGFISFDRADSIRTSGPSQNVCGNPPDDPSFSTSNCKLLTSAITDTALSIPVSNITGFAGSNGYVLIDNEIVKYATAAGSTLTISGVANRGYGFLATSRYYSPARSHANGAAVYYLGTSDPTLSNSTADILRGISNFDPTTYEVSGWARALSWKEYQENTVCAGGIGPSYPPPCDKEWGWIKLAGTWQTVNRGKFTGPLGTTGCSTKSLVLDTVDGYPDPNPQEEVYLKFTDFSQEYWPYTDIDRTTKTITLVDDLAGVGTPNCLVQQSNGTTPVPWATQPTGLIQDDATFRNIPLRSVAGLLATGKIEVTQGALREIMEYSEIDVPSNTLLNVTRGVDGTAPELFNTIAKVVQLNESGLYQTYALPIGPHLAEKTLIGYAWSAPNTDTPFPGDPSVSRYQENISGFGWISFQPNQLKLIYPFLRTLFGDIYSGGTIDLVGPDPDLVPAQYSSTYLIQTNNTITPLYTGAPLPSAGAYERCVLENAAESPEVISERCDPLNPGAAVPDLSIDASIPDKAQFYDDLANIVSDCKYKINSTVQDDPTCTQGRSIASQAPLPGLFTNYGLNKFGHRVILCRANPNLPKTGDWSAPTTWQMNAKAAFSLNGYNPIECGFAPSAAPAFNKVALGPEPRIYIFPDDYDGSDPLGLGFFLFNYTLQFNNASTGNNGAVTFMIPGSVMFDDAQMRYCPEGIPMLPCTVGDSPPIDSIRQLASAGWVIRGSATNEATGRFYGDAHYPEAKNYRMGSFLLLGDNDNWGKYSNDGTYASAFSATNFQLNVYGLIIAPYYRLNAAFYTLDPDQKINSPAENIVYDGRALANPPPGFADITTGLPLIRRVTP